MLLGTKHSKFFIWQTWGTATMLLIVFGFQTCHSFSYL